MEIKDYFIAKVTNNIDPDEEGKVQINIPELFHTDDPINGLTVIDLPWARQDREMSSNIPEINDYIWVYPHQKEFWRNWYYRNKVDLKLYNLHKDFETTIKANITGMSGVYPYVKYNLLPNGLCIGYSTTPLAAEYFIYSPLGTYFFIDSTGNLTINIAAISKLKIKNTLTSLKSITDDLQSIIQNLVTPGNLIGNYGAPVVYTMAATDLPKIILAQQKITSLLGE